MSYYVRSPYRGRTSAGSVEHQRFSQEYFSGSQVNIYFGDIWVDEITAMELSIQENVQPIYGYASYTADAWARGTRLITGTFRINFKESYYLHAILNELQYKAQENQEPFHSGQNKQPAVKTIEELLAMTNEPMAAERFENIANEYQNAIWGRTIDGSFLRKMENQETDAYFYSRMRQPDLHSEGFNMLITYGPFIEAHNYIYKDDKITEHVDHTIESISGVQIAAMTKVIQGSGQPIEEQYTFVAKDINYKIK